MLESEARVAFDSPCGYVVLVLPFLCWSEEAVLIERTHTTTRNRIRA